MTKQEFTTRLKKEGWSVKKYSDYENWQCGDVTLTLKYDNEGDTIIELTDDEWGYLNKIEGISFTPYRILIQWEAYQEWYLKY